jgi:hypothetical protein
LILPTPARVQSWNPFGIVKVDSEDFRKLVNPKWPNSHDEAL